MKKVITYMYLKDGQMLLADGTLIQNSEVYCQACANSGADLLLFVDDAHSEEEHHKNMELLKQVSKADLGAFAAGGPCEHIDDVKKYLYTGAKGMFFTADAAEQLMKEGLSRFKSKKAGFLAMSAAEAQRAYEIGFRTFYCLNGEGAAICECLKKKSDAVVYCLYDTDKKAIQADADGLIYSVPEKEAGKVMDLKHALLAEGVETEVFEAAFDWSDLKLNGDGMIPVIVQDFRNEEVLMMAYMNQEAYELTVSTGRMTYYSRSRQSLWIKGETSGHYQYVRSLKIDCDQDTLLAKVVQVGAACHTGNRSCFYRNVVERKAAAANPYKVFESVYNTIADRKQNPKEGSYTNYLFDKGLDKILKKVGEEATELVIAAKNPNPEEIVYELGDFLYHVMVLMAEKGITWEDVAKELADRE